WRAFGSYLIFCLGVSAFLLFVCGVWALVVARRARGLRRGAEDKDTGAASGINNAVSRIGGLIAVAAMGSLAAWVYAGVLGTAAGSGIPGFGEPPPAGLAPGLDAARLAASDAAFAAVAAVTAVLCLLSAIAAWTTVSGERLPWARDTANQHG
ncbi:MFS transporter, partial [Mesorhizobium sp. M0968]